MAQHRVILLGVLCVLGCGGSDEPQRHALRGSVQVEGATVVEGTISFLPSQGNGAQPAHTSIKGGEYQFTRANGPFSGAHRVVVGIKTTAEDEPTASASDETAGQNIKEAAAPRRRNPYQRKPAPKKLQWQVEYVVPADGDDRKDFDFGG